MVPSNYPDKQVCILGLGFVGLTLATTMADIGFQVIGIEKREDLLQQINQGNAGFFEPSLSVKLKKVIENRSLQVFKTIPKNCRATVFIITVGTPLNTNKKINLHSIKKVAQGIAKELKDGDLVLLRSTVKLGATRSVVFPILQKTKKRFQIAFCPERTIEGQAMAELRYLPQIVGADDLATGLRASLLFQFMTPTVIRVRDLETAEMIKLVANTKRDVAFGFANEVARMCDVVGLNADEVISGGGFGYSRTDIPRPGPVGGPCLSKDSHILIQSMMEYGMVPKITVASRKTNEAQPNEVVDFLIHFLKQFKEIPIRPIISLLGIAFKGRPITDDIRGTTAQPIFEALQRAFPLAFFQAYDPVVSEETIQDFGLSPKKEAIEAFRGAHIVLILNNHPFFASMPLEQWTAQMACPGIIYDFWNNYRPENLHLPEKIYYIGLGNHKHVKTQRDYGE